MSTPRKGLEDLIDLMGDVDPSWKCRHVWDQLFPTIEYSSASLAAWLGTDHNVPRSKVYNVGMDVVLKLLREQLQARQAGENGKPRKKTPDTWTREAEAEGRRILGVTPNMTANDFTDKVGGNRQVAQALYRHITEKPKRQVRND